MVTASRVMFFEEIRGFVRAPAVVIVSGGGMVVVVLVLRRVLEFQGLTFDGARGGGTENERGLGRNDEKMSNREMTDTSTSSTTIAVLVCG